MLALKTVAAALVLGLAACAGGTLTGTGAITTETPAAEAGGGAYSGLVPSAEDTAKSGQSQFNPFGDPLANAPGGREVIQNPTVADVMQTGPLAEMTWGKADAPVTVIKYASLTCPHCREFHQTVFPAFKKAYIDTGKARFIIREFPIGKTSGLATIAIRCAKPEKYLDLYGKFMSQQANWVSQEVRPDAVFAIASQVGMTRAEFDACAKNHAMIEGLKWIKERGRKLGVIGTPNFFVGGKFVKKTLSLAELQAMIDPLLAGGATANAGPAR